MKAITIITIIIFVLMFLFCAKHLWKEWKIGRAPHADDDLHNLNYKIENNMMDDNNELYLLKLIKEYRVRPDINKKKLQKLEVKFRRRYSQLHMKDNTN